MNSAKVFNIDSIFDQVETDYLLEGKESFQIELRRPSHFKDYYQCLEMELRNFSEIKICGFRKVKEGFTFISRPSIIGFDIEYLARCRPHLKLMRKLILQIESKYKEFFPVSSFIRSFPKDSLQNLEILEACLDIFKFLINNQNIIKGFLPRHIPHGQSTKLIGKESLLLKVFLYYLRLQGKNYENINWLDFYSYFELERVRNEFRFFAPFCKIQTHNIVNFNGVFDYESLKQFDFSEISATLIIENFSSFYALAQCSKKTLILWGGGFRAVSLISMLKSLPHPIFYWGDIDKEGYEIYGLLKSEFQFLRSIMMDNETLNQHRHLIQKKQPFSGPYKNLFELQNIYEQVSSLGFQIEQEQLEIHWPLKDGEIQLD